MVLSALEDSSEALDARVASRRSGEEYDNVRKMLNRMLHAGQVVSPARGLYTLPGHPCLAQYPVVPSTIAASPDPAVPNVSIVPNTPVAPDPANDQDTDPQTASVPGVSIVPNISTTQTAPDSATDQNTNSQATSVPTATPTPPTTHLITPDESAEAWESDPDQQPYNP